MEGSKLNSRNSGIPDVKVQPMLDLLLPGQNKTRSKIFAVLFFLPFHIFLYVGFCASVQSAFAVSNFDLSSDPYMSVSNSFFVLLCSFRFYLWKSDFFPHVPRLGQFLDKKNDNVYCPTSLCGHNVSRHKNLQWRCQGKRNKLLAS